MSNGNLHDLFPLSVIILSFLKFRQFEQLLSSTTSGSFHSVRNLLKQKGLFNHSPGLFSFSCGSFWVGVNTVADQNNWIKAYLKKWSQFGYKQTVVWFVCGMNLICPKLQKNCKFWGKKTAPVATCAVHYGLEWILNQQLAVCRGTNMNGGLAWSSDKIHYPLAFWADDHIVQQLDETHKIMKCSKCLANSWRRGDLNGVEWKLHMAFVDIFWFALHFAMCESN